MTTQQGELLIRQKNAQTQRPEWARAYVVLAVDERQLFCFTDDKLDAPRFVLQLRGACVGRVDGARDGAHRFSVVTDAPPPRSFLPAAAAAALAAGAAATASLALAGAMLLALAAALLAAVAPRVQRAGSTKVLLAATSRRRAETWRQHVAGCAALEPGARRRRAQESSVRRCAVSVRSTRDDLIRAVKECVHAAPGGRATRVQAPRRGAALATGPDESVPCLATAEPWGASLEAHFSDGDDVSTKATFRVREGQDWDGVALDCEAVAVARRPLAAERLDAIARRVALLGLAAKDAAEARRFVDVGARARDELDRFATAEDDDDDEAEAAFVEEADEADENAAWRPWARALHDATPTCGKRYWSSPRADTFPVRGANYLRDRIKVLNRGDAQFALAAVDLLWHRDPAGIEADDGERKGLHVCGHPRNRLALARKAYEGCDAFTMVVTLVVPGPPAYTLAMYYVCKDPAALKDQATPLGRVARPFFFGDDDTYRDARFKLTPRMLDSNWVVRKAVGQRPAVLGKQLKQWYWRGADYLEIDIDIGSSQIAAGVVRLCGGYAKALVVDISFVIEGKRDDELPEQILGTIQIRNLDVTKGRPLPT